jgi:hypothetical protein
MKALLLHSSADEHFCCRAGDGGHFRTARATGFVYEFGSTLFALSCTFASFHSFNSLKGSLVNIHLLMITLSLKQLICLLFTDADAHAWREVVTWSLGIAGCLCIVIGAGA